MLLLAHKKKPYFSRTSSVDSSKTMTLTIFTKK